MINVRIGKTEIIFDENSLHFSIRSGGEEWHWRKAYRPRLACQEGEVDFQDAVHIEHERVKNGTGEGIRSRYQGFRTKAGKVPYGFETWAWIEEATGHVYFEWIPMQEDGLHVQRLYWPGEMDFDQKRPDWYTLLNIQQGLLVPNTWEEELGKIAFDGFFGTAGGYMPWFSQVKGQAGYIAICATPWDAGYQADHPAGGPYTHVGIRFEPSLGKMAYKRTVRYTFMDGCDYNHMCQVYRTYAKEQGLLKTLAEKAAKNPSVDRLIGCSFLHLGIKTHVRKDSDFYDPKAPEQNNHLATFAQREEDVRKLCQAGVKKAYLHLDGWADPGYDNQHPDFYPACQEAGGWEGMARLASHLQEWGYLFGIHDQYRDYYLSAPSFDPDYACQLPGGAIPRHQRWAGGPQSYLCATQAPYYLKRNLAKIQDHGIRLDCAYLDVFTCNEGDECFNPRHPMTRRECYGYRNQCFEYLLSQNILPSSEEVSDWSMASLVFCHYAPYDFMLRQPQMPKKGIPIPLFNLVYHDCAIIPWMMEKVSPQEDYMLHALLNGGAPYLVRKGVYPNFDGAFGGHVELSLEENIKRCQVVSQLHEKVAKCQMVRHQMVDGDWKVQRTTFADGTAVTVDFENQEYFFK